jgi:hypothetical protein
VTLRSAAAPPEGDGRAVLVVRPEHLHIDDGDAPADANRLSAHVERVLYLGGSRKLVVRFATGDSGLIIQSSDAPGTVAEGSDITVWWRPDECLLVADTGEGGAQAEDPLLPDEAIAPDSQLTS